MLFEMLKFYYRRYCKIFNYFPFVNTIVNNGIKNHLILGTPLISCKIIIQGSYNEIVFLPSQNGGMRGGYIHIDGSHNSIVVGEKATLINTILYMEDSNNTISIGSNTKISGDTELACIEGTTIHIGEDCLFSSKIKFRTGDSHSILDLDGHRINESKNISIGNHVWIGHDVKILKGVSVGDGSIIGTGSVVTKTWGKQNVVISGNPAVVVKEGVQWKTERI